MYFHNLLVPLHIEMKGNKMDRCTCGACLSRRSLELTIALESKFGRTSRLHAAPPRNASALQAAGAH